MYPITKTFNIVRVSTYPEISFFEKLTDFNSPHWWFEVVDLAIVLFLLFQIFKFVRGTAAMRIFVGAVAIYIIYKTTQFFRMELMTEILGQFIGVGFITLIIVFQQEIRKFLLLIASPKIYNRFLFTKWLFRIKSKNENIENTMIDPIVSVCEKFSKNQTGALIIVSSNDDLEAYKTLGEILDSEIKATLLEAIFHKESPLHDGAVLIAGNRILAARCVLPISDRPDLPGELGLRHRAAIGVTENSGATAIVVSEQNGSISLCSGGKLKNNVSIKRLRFLLSSLPG